MSPHSYPMMQGKVNVGNPIATLPGDHSRKHLQSFNMIQHAKELQCDPISANPGSYRKQHLQSPNMISGKELLPFDLLKYKVQRLSFRSMQRRQEAPNKASAVTVYASETQRLTYDCTMP